MLTVLQQPRMMATVSVRPPTNGERRIAGQCPTTFVRQVSREQVKPRALIQNRREYTFNREYRTVFKFTVRTTRTTESVLYRLLHAAAFFLLPRRVQNMTLNVHYAVS